MYLYNQLQMTIFIYCITNATPMQLIPFIDMLPAGYHSIAFLYLIPCKVS